MTTEQSGFVYYQSGNVAIMRNKVDGGILSYFYNDDVKNTLVANFNAAGVGFVYYPNGEQRFLASHKTVTYFKNDKHTDVLRCSWKGLPTVCPSGIEFAVNSLMFFRCVHQRDIRITFRGGSQTTPLEIQLGRTDTFKKGGKVPTLIERQAEAAKNPAEEKAKWAQKLHMSLPRVSASGRECSAVQLRSELVPIRTSLETVNSTLRAISAEHSMTFTNPTAVLTNTAPASLGMSKAESLSFSRSAEKLQLSKTVGMGGGRGLEKRLGHTAYVVPPKKKAVRPLPVIHPKQLKSIVKMAQQGQLVVALCSDRADRSKKMEKAFATLREEQRRERLRQEKALNSSRSNQTPRTPRGTTGQQNESNQTPRTARETTAASPREQDETKTEEITSNEKKLSKSPKQSFDIEAVNDPLVFLTVDCSTSSLLAKQYGFSAYPLCLMYWNGKLGFINSTFNGFGTSLDDIRAQVQLTWKNCRQGSIQFYADNFRF